MDVDKLIKDAPKEMAEEEVLRSTRDYLGADPRCGTGPFTPVATIALNVVRFAATDGAEIVEQMNRQLGTSYPCGDAVVACTMLVDAEAYLELLNEREPSAAARILALDKTWGSMAEEAYFVPHWEHAAEHGNLVGWRQFRKRLPGEACAPLPEAYR